MPAMAGPFRLWAFPLSSPVLWYFLWSFPSSTKPLPLFDNPKRIKEWFSKPEEVREPSPEPVFTMTAAQKEIAKQFALLVRTMEDHFFPAAPAPPLNGFRDQKSPCQSSGAAQVPDHPSRREGFFTWDEAMFAQTIA